MRGPAPIRFESRAEEDLQVIRRAMERTTTFTAVPGAGGVGMGLAGLAAAGAGTLQPTPERWLAVWLGAAALAFGIGLATMRRKARRAGEPMTGASARQFALGLGTPLAAGALLTVGLYQAHAWSLMPAAWLLLYGTGVLSGGAFSIPIVRGLGAAFLALGVAAMVTPPAWGNAWLALGFGGLQIGAGLYIWRRHGG